MNLQGRNLLLGMQSQNVLLKLELYLLGFEDVFAPPPMTHRSYRAKRVTRRVRATESRREATRVQVACSALTDRL